MIEEFIHELPDRAIKLGIKVVIALVFIFIAWQLINLLCRIIRKWLSKLRAEEATVHFIVKLIKTALWILLILSVMVAFGFDTATVIALIGSAGVAVGLAVQGALSNMAGGILILLVKPFKVGDYIVEDFGGHEGIVTEISLINTKLKTLDNRVVILPNGKLTDTSLINSTGLSERCLETRVQVSYSADIDDVRLVLAKAAQESPYSLENRDIAVFVDELADSGVVMGVRMIVNTADYRSARWDMNERVKKALDAAGIEIPYPQMDVHMR